MIDELIREITEPEAESEPAAKKAARERLLLAAQVDRPQSRRSRRLGPRGVAALVALVAVPTGVAVATELSGDGDQRLIVSDCPELLAGVEERGLDTEGLQLVSCPQGAEVEDTLSLLARLEQRRAQLGDGEEAIGVVGGSPGEKSWGMEGITGTTEGEGE